MGTRLEWTTGSNGLRRGVQAETRYAWPRSLHIGAAAIAVASPFVATVAMLCATLLSA